MNTKRYYYLALWAACLVGCTALADRFTATEETIYLTLIPRETLMAFHEGTPVVDRLQAAIAGWKALNVTRLEFDSEPALLYAEFLHMEEARKLREKSGKTDFSPQPDNLMVWLVIFKGRYTIVGPDPLHTVTPPPPRLGCVYALIDAESSAMIQAGTIDCPQ